MPKIFAKLYGIHSSSMQLWPRHTQKTDTQMDSAFLILW